MSDELWVVVPAFNEATAIEGTLVGLSAFLPNVVVVDDGSSDETRVLATDFGAVCVRHAVNLGQGAALQTGIDFALAHGATHICTFDADGQHDPSAIERMLEAAHRGSDVVLGSRFIGGTIEMPVLKRALLQLAVRFTRAQTRLPLTDAHNGLRLFTRGAAESIRISQPGMAHASEIVASVARSGLRVTEIPTVVRYSDYSRMKGQRLSNSIKIMLDLAYAAFAK